MSKVDNISRHDAKSQRGIATVDVASLRRREKMSEPGFSGIDRIFGIGSFI
jgi:hypothetical protein